MKLFVIFKCVIVFTQIFALPVEENEIKPSEEVNFSENEDVDEIESIKRHKKSHPTICVEIKPSVNNERPFVMCKNNYQSPVNGYQNGLHNIGGFLPQNNYGHSDMYVNNGYQSRNYGIPANRYNPQTTNYAVLNPSYAIAPGYQKSVYAQPHNYVYNGVPNNGHYLSPPASTANINYRQHNPTEYRSNYGYNLPQNQKNTNYGAPFSPNYNSNSYKSPTCGSSILVGCQPRVIPVGCSVPDRSSYSSYSPQPITPSYYSEPPQIYHPPYSNPKPVQNDIKSIPQNYRSSSANESSLFLSPSIQAISNVSTSTQLPQENDKKDDKKAISIEKDKASKEHDTLKKMNEMKTRLVEANKEASSVSSSNSIPGANAQGPGPQNYQQTSFYQQYI